MARKPKFIVCIYCKEKRKASREHLLARSLGGDATEPITCVPCNTTKLSALDAALARRSLVAMSRVAHAPLGSADVALEGNHFHYDAANDVHADVALIGGLRPRPFPQLHVRYGTNEMAVTTADKDGAASLVAFIDARLAQSTLRDLYVKIGPPDQCSTARVVVHRPDDGYIRVRARGDELNVIDVIEQHWAEIRAQITAHTPVVERIENPTIRTTVRVVLDDVFRAVAKTAFNVLAADVGVDFVLRAEFDPLRAYVLGDVRHAPLRQPDEVAVDTRFVQMVQGDEHGLPSTLPDEHLVILFYHTGHVRALAALYGEHAFFVDLGAVDQDDFSVMAHRFSTDRSGNAVLDAEELYERFLRKNQS